MPYVIDNIQTSLAESRACEVFYMEHFLNNNRSGRYYSLDHIRLKGLHVLGASVHIGTVKGMVSNYIAYSKSVGPS